ncbi:MAG: diacylglycerol kinase family protein [Fibrobacteria bacterium]|nr:diacylglycerol kinase family protein [Fibrobacteria bacterium]
MNKNLPDKPFSPRDRLHSFRFAFKGILLLLKTQHNAWIHTMAAICVILFGLILKISAKEWCLVFLAIGGVFAAEAFNTAIEYLVDMVSPDYHEKAGKIKDLAAGAVLLIAFAAALTGLIIFLPKLF